MYKGFNPHEPYFQSVSLALILVGALIFSLGGVEWILNLLADYDFNAPFLKILGGLVVTGLGYIHLELELIRISRKG